MEKNVPFFELNNISKYFAKVVANKDVSFSIQRGEVLALLGENGAGKSTIMKILYGLYQADKGTIFKEGQRVEIKTPKDAQKLGIAMIQQHFSLVAAHTVTENIILGTVNGFINYEQSTKKVEEIALKYGFNLPTDQLIKDLDVGTQQKVEIVKALYLNTELLIMDEPTAVLTPQESEQLMEFVKTYTKAGNSVIFITHKLKEVMQVADRIIVMRDGMVVGNLEKNTTTEADLTRLMMGEEILPIVKKNKQPLSHKIMLSLNNVSLSEGLIEISFQIHQGEIFGIAGVSGNGQEELCESIIGLSPITKGTIDLNGCEISSMSITERINMGIGYVPVDRYRDAMVAEMSIAENMLLKSYNNTRWQTKGFIKRKPLAQYTDRLIEKYRVKTPSSDTKIGSLSGGNQQKVILGREVDLGTELLVLNQPTRGLDLGAIDNIHKTIISEKQKGKGVLLVSTELSEIFEICDRVAVMYKGKIMGIYRTEEIGIEEIGLLMAGYELDKEEAIG